MEWPIEAHDYVRWLNSGYISGFSEVKLGLKTAGNFAENWNILAKAKTTEVFLHQSRPHDIFVPKHGCVLIGSLSSDHFQACLLFGSMSMFMFDFSDAWRFVLFGHHVSIHLRDRRRKRVAKMTTCSARLSFWRKDETPQFAWRALRHAELTSRYSTTQN